MMKLYVVYDHPADHPDWVVVREWLVAPGIDRPFPSGFTTHATIEDARAAIDTTTLVRIDRDPGDDPKILETWL